MPVAAAKRDLPIIRHSVASATATNVALRRHESATSTCRSTFERVVQDVSDARGDKHAGGDRHIAEVLKRENSG